MRSVVVEAFGPIPYRKGDAIVTRAELSVFNPNTGDLRSETIGPRQIRIVTG